LLSSGVGEALHEQKFLSSWSLWPLQNASHLLAPILLICVSIFLFKCSFCVKLECLIVLVSFQTQGMGFSTSLNVHPLQ
jgi:hypothetical protein